MAFKVSKTTPTMMIKEVPEKEILLTLNTPEMIMGTNAIIASPVAPIKIIYRRIPSR